VSERERCISAAAVARRTHKGRSNNSALSVEAGEKKQGFVVGM
jgi:hypothetical protein